MLERPVIFSNQTIRRLLAPDAEPPAVLIWIRESFSTRLDPKTDTVRIRYPADPPDAEPRVVPAATMPACFRSKTYVTHKAKHMPRAAARFCIRGEARKAVPP